MLTRESDRILRIVQFLAAPENIEKGSTAKIMLQEIGLPAIILRNTLRSLAAAGVIVSQRGRTGGVAIAEKTLGLTVFEVLNIMDREESREHLHAWRSDPSRNNDPVQELMLRAQSALREIFDGTTIAQLAARYKK